MGRIRVGFIGVGLRGRGQAETLATQFSERAEVTALADLNPDHLAAARDALPSLAPRCFERWQDVLSLDDLDAVCISTPQFAHREIAVASFQAGKHVYCEKPLALTLDDADAILAAGREAGRVLIVGQQMRYHLHLHRMRQVIEEGRIGVPALTWLKEFRNPFPETMAWAFDKSKSGGALVEKSCHHFDVFSWMLDARPVSVYASGGQAVHKEIFGAPSSVADHAWVTVEHEGGRRAMLGLCFFAGIPHRQEGGAGTHVRDIGVIGDKGMVTTEGFHMGRDLEVRYSDRPDVDRMVMEPSKGDRSSPFERDGNHGIWVDFFNCIEDGGEPLASGAVGRDALAVALAAEQSMASGQPVTIKDLG